MQFPLVSVIIPCYNSGQCLIEAIDSVMKTTGNISYEIVVINDGSTDINTLNALEEISLLPTIVVHQVNKGAAAARNAGVKIAKGKYILPLDSDNKIKPEYIEVGSKILDENHDVGVVHTDLNCFGDNVAHRVYKGGELDIKEMLAINQIDMCSMIRKSVWDELDGMDESLPALEDWDFFLRVYTLGWKFRYVNKVLFEYRIREGSLMDQLFKDKSKADYLKLLISVKHIKLKSQQYDELVQYYKVVKNDKKKPLRTFIKLLYTKYFSKNIA